MMVPGMQSVATDWASYSNRLLLLQEMVVNFNKLEPEELLYRVQTQVNWLFTHAQLHVFSPDTLDTPPSMSRGKSRIEGLGEVYIAYHKGPPDPLYLALSGVDLSDVNELRFAALFFEQLLTMLSNAGYRQLLEQQALNDWLTGLGNYRSFERTLVQKSAGTRRLALLSLDNLLAVNASEGYMAGDLLLRRLGKLLTELLPERSAAFRVGGGTFALLVPPA